ncbi:respiratory nitrate reductase subunit gamma [Rehaibacterium terrae]|nr:respiratory nitrate reductase subunit gamma [Rehaibacterium terrae]
MHYLDQFFFQLYPYIALAVFLIGSWVRFDRDAYTWRTGSSQLLSDRWLFWGSNLFHIGVIAILLGHFVGLLTPEWAYKPFISSGTKQLLAMAVGGFFGALCLIGLSMLIIRRLTQPRVRVNTAGRDWLVLWLLLAQLLLGLFSIVVSADHLDGAVMVQLGHWAQHIVTFRWGAADFVADVHWVYKAHIALGMTLFLIFPFTRLVHIWSVPLGYLRRPWQVVRRRGATLRYAGK